MAANGQIDKQIDRQLIPTVFFPPNSKILLENFGSTR